MIVFDEEKRILRYCPIIEERFWILYQLRFSCWSDEGCGSKNYKKDIIMYLMNEFKGNAKFIFLFNPQKSSLNVCLIKILKSTLTKKKIIVRFNNLREENF